ncbi:hypothetical protein C5167_049174 [Papaver somniferum]|uniref:Uncharacterized protein n=1 Tax=Papaver somniferum TaxID=3469 RepID=A0A4Y7KLG0_PAPSO|nr:hypothetical protein C5167_049174 [Papaver somniferum]
MLKIRSGTNNLKEKMSLKRKETEKSTQEYLKVSMKEVLVPLPTKLSLSANIDLVQRERRRTEREGALAKES